MKTLNFVKSGLILVSVLVSQGVLAAPFYSSKDWAAEIVPVHDFWGQEACVATTVGSDKITRLEVIALRGTNGAFLEPMVQVIGPMTEAFIEITADSGGSRVFDLLPLYNNNTGAIISAVAKLDEREKLAEEIAGRSKLVAKYYDAQGLIKTVNFSLRGSSSTLSALFKQCGLAFEPMMDLLD